MSGDRPQITQHAELFTALAEPFSNEEVKSRSQAGRSMLYITARSVMNRLDAVVGPENWWDEYSSHQDNSVFCKLSIRMPDGTIVTKCDVGGNAGMQDQGDDDKSGVSDAFKRAAVKFGVGRHLYKDGWVRFNSREESEVIGIGAQCYEQIGQDRGLDRQPAPAPQGGRPPGGGPNGPTTPPRSNGNGNGGGHGIPRTGKAMFAWVREQEQKYEIDLLRFLNGWAKLQEFPSRMVDWDANQTQAAHAEACKKLKSHVGGDWSGETAEAQTA